MGLDWNKNSRGRDHGALFQSGDRKRVQSDQINYDYYVDNDEELAPNELALVRPLKDVLPRLELLVRCGSCLPLKNAAASRGGCPSRPFCRFLHQPGFPSCLMSNRLPCDPGSRCPA